MKMLSRKTIVAMIAGTFIIAGAASPFLVQAAEGQQSPSAYHTKQQITPEETAKRLSDTFGIGQSTILTYHNNGMDFKDISRAAFLAKASGKSIENVMSIKTASNKWSDVAKAMSITKEQMQAASQEISANHLNKNMGLEKATALNLLHQGYHPGDIGMASKLAKNTNKPMDFILSLKKINNKWSDVANTLGVDAQTFQNDLKEMGHASFRNHENKDSAF